MKNLVILFLTSLVLLSCGSDDSGSGSSVKPTSVLQSSQGNLVNMNFTYDENDRLKSIQRDAEFFELAYDSQSRLSTITRSGEQMSYTYDGSGHLASVTYFNGTSVPINYLGNNSYDLGGAIFNVSSEGGIRSQNAVSTNYSSQKGAFANVKSFNGFALYFLSHDYSAFATKKRLKEIVSNGDVIAYTHTEGENGLPAISTIGNLTLTYAYSQ